MSCWLGSRRVIIWAAILSWGPAMSGCASALRVKSGEAGGSKTESIEGIPFFSRVPSYKQTTAYERSWLATSLGLKFKIESDKAGGSPTEVDLPPIKRTVPKSALPELRQFEQALLETGLRNGDLDSLLKTFGDLPDTTGRVSTELIENSLEEGSVVDYTTVYYLNARLPWFSSAQVSGTLGDNGTLSQASAQVSATVPEGLPAAHLPVKEFLKAQIAGASAAEAGQTLLPEGRPAGARVSLTVTFSAETEGYRYVFVSSFRTDPRDKNLLAPIPLNLSNGMFKTVPIQAKGGDPGDDAAKAPKKEKSAKDK